jgi:hypothetical protein
MTWDCDLAVAVLLREGPGSNGRALRLRLPGTDSRLLTGLELVERLTGHADRPADADRSNPAVPDQLIRLVLPASEDGGDLPHLQCLVVVVGQLHSSSCAFILRETLEEDDEGCKVILRDAEWLCFTASDE